MRAELKEQEKLITSSDEYVRAVGQYMKPFASTPKSGRGEGGGGEKGKGFALS